ALAEERSGDEDDQEEGGDDPVERRRAAKPLHRIRGHSPWNHGDLAATNRENLYSKSDALSQLLRTHLTDTEVRVPRTPVLFAVGLGGQKRGLAERGGSRMACATREQHQNHRHDNPALLHTRLHRPDLPQGSRSVHPPGRRCRHVRGLPRELGRRWWWNSWRWRWNSRRRARIRWPGSARAPKYLGIDLVGSERENSGVVARLDDLSSQVVDGVVHNLAD